MRGTVISIVLTAALVTPFAVGSAQTRIGSSKIEPGSDKPRNGSKGLTNHQSQKNSPRNQTKPVIVRSATPYPIGFDHRFPRVSGFTFPRR